MISPGQQFRLLVEKNPPLVILGAINAYAALMAAAAGGKALYLSGAGVANASFGLPDLGITTRTEVLEEARRITAVSSLPLLVDIDTGFGHHLSIARTIRQMEHAGVAAVQLEDQSVDKRCGHRPNKQLVSMQTMGDRIKAAVDARQDASFVIMARTDAYASEGLHGVIDRAQYYKNLGADMLFPEALVTLQDYQAIKRDLEMPILANITEFGKTPLWSSAQLHAVGVDMVLYPLSAFRAMSKAALQVYRTILEEGSQVSLLSQMQTREELYAILNYLEDERVLDESREKGNE